MRILHFSDFVTCCMDELVNQTAKIRYMLGGQVKIPMVIWYPDGAGIRAAAKHSQSLEDFVLPKVSDVVEAAREVVYRKIK